MGFKEIVTKAVIGKGKKSFKNNYSITTENIPTTVLGCWVINHKFKGYKSGDNIGVDGSYDVNIWYSYDNDSKTTVVNKKIDYNDIFHVKTKENTEFYDEKSLHELTNDMNQELFENNIPVEKNVENLETSDIPDSELIDLIDKTTNSEEYFDILEGKFNDK